MNDSNYHPLPQPHELSPREKEDGMGAYLMMFAAMGAGLPLPVINLVAAIIYYYLNRSKSRFIHFHCLQSLLSQIPTTVINWGVVFIAVRIWIYDDTFTDIHEGYLWMALVANLIYFIYNLVAAIRARKGRFYYFIFFGKFSYQAVYSLQNTTVYAGEESTAEAPLNKPPI